ncbi:hypothetical protein KAH94_00465, partial [bacterium]|nr:hypothetical protein [bacterium]
MIKENMFGELFHKYTDGINNKKVAVIGPYPPPLGGVAVHVKRVIIKLKKQHNDVRCFDSTAKHRWRFFLYCIKLFFFLLFFRPQTVFYNTIYLTNSLPELRLFYFLQKFLRFDMTCIEHNCRHMYKRDKSFKKYLSSFFNVNKIVFIGDSTYKSYVENGVTFLKDFSVESAFLPPDESQEQKILQTYPALLFSFIQLANPLIVANAFQLSLLDGK